MNHCHDNDRVQTGTILTIRCHSGLSGDMLVAGLTALNLEKASIPPGSPECDQWLGDLLDKIMPGLGQLARLRPAQVQGIYGVRLQTQLPHEHEHRNLEDIRGIIAEARMGAWAMQAAINAFTLLAECEARAHGLPLDKVHFHEVGALDSILDICAVCELFHLLGPQQLICGPLPLADGSIRCAHGVLLAPAPAVLRMLKGIPTRPFEGKADAGELVTPTALALLHALGAGFGPWPTFKIEATATVYGQKVFEDAPNGAIFALGSPLPIRE